MIQARGTIKSIPEWWMRELKDIDPTYYPVYNQEYDYFSIMKKIVYLREENGKLERTEVETPLATFRYLNDSALANLRKRKAIGREFERESNPDAYINWVMSEALAAKRQAKELALDMKAEGYMRMHRYLTTTTVS